MRLGGLVALPILAALSLAGSGALVAAPVTSAVASAPDCPLAPTNDPPQYADDRGRLPGLLGLDAIHERFAGAGVGVAVIDTGVGGRERIRNVVDGHASAGVKGGLQDAHGTVVAGLVAGRDRDGRALGVAPDATIVSIKAADARGEIARGSDEPRAQVTDSRLAEAIRTATAMRKTHRIKVINLSLNLPEEDKGVSDAIRAATRAGILVVGSVGNRPVDGRDNPDPAWKPGEDQVQFPATHQDVLGVTSLGPGESFYPELVWTGPGVDVSAPLAGVVSVDIGGGTCAVPPGSSYATAIVSGVAALLFEAFPAAGPEQVATRIMATAQGGMRDGALDGHGMVQPDEALTAQLDVAADGTLRRAPDYTPPDGELVAPPLPEDDSAETRATLLWWGVGAGGLLLAALLLRPLTRRRA